MVGSVLMNPPLAPVGVAWATPIIIVPDFSEPGVRSLRTSMEKSTFDTAQRFRICSEETDAAPARLPPLATAGT